MKAWMVGIALLGTFCPTQFIFSQNVRGVTDEEYDHLEQIIKTTYGERYRISDVMNPDTIYPAKYPSLHGCLVFSAYTRGSRPLPPFVGVLKGAQILWSSEREINKFVTPSIDQISDINNDNNPEIFVLCSGGVSAISYELWIYTWNGLSGTRINPINEGRSQMSYFNMNEDYEFVDTNGDGIKEIRINTLENETLYYYWDGFELREGSPQPFTTLPRDRLSIEVKSTIDRVGQELRFRYYVTNRETSLQAADDLMLKPAAGLRISSIAGRSSWRPASGPSFVRWTNLFVFGERNYIKPGEMDSSFFIQLEGLPRIAMFYVQGHNGDEFSGEKILNNSANGFTITAWDPPPLIDVAFLDTLISYKHQALNLGWIKNQGIANSLDQKLDAAKAQLEKKNNKAAKNILEAFINEVEAQKDKHLTSEAYALLKFNAEYLISKL